MFRSLTTALLTAMLLVFATQPLTVGACQWAGWSPEDISRHAKLIVEARVTRALQPEGVELYVLKSYRGSTDGVTVEVGTEEVTNCFGRLPLEPGDHVVLALSRPASTNAGESVAWWVDSDASTIIGWMGANFEDLAALAEVRAILAGLPETATADDPPGGGFSIVWPIVAIVFVLVFALGLRRFAIHSVG